MSSGNGVNPETKTRSTDKASGHSLLDRVKEPPQLPGKDVRLLKANEATLQSFGIPPRPDPVSQHGAFRIWKKFFGRRVTFVRAGIKLGKEKFQLNAGTDMGAASSQSRFEKSSNWSGTYVVPNGGDMVLVIMGRWTVPTPSLPPPQEQARGPNAEYACSTWIGLDGQRLYLNSSLPQIGTTQTLNIPGSGPPAVAAYAWFQWWERLTGGRRPIVFSHFPVAIGDEIACLIWVTGAGNVVAAIRNLGTNHVTYVIATAPIVAPPGGAARELTISGATAEWIMERPTHFGSTEPYWFPNYGSTQFLDCRAATGPGPGVPQRIEDLEAPRLIWMYDTLLNPTRTCFISMAQKLSDTTARVHYGDF